MRFASAVRLRDERGMALAVAIFALVVIAALVTGSYLAAFAHGRLSRNGVFAAQAFEAAEAGVDDVMTNWTPNVFNASPVATDVALTTRSLGANTRYTPVITKLNANLFLIRALGERTSAAGLPLARRTVATLVRIQQPHIDIRAALTVQGDLTIGGSSQISGDDHVPPSWGGTCPPPGTSLAGVRDSSNSINYNGANCAGGACITPITNRVMVDSTVSSNTFNQFGDVTYDELAAMADKEFADGTTLTGLGPTLTSTSPQRCQIGDDTNWGAPLASGTPCFDYFPLIHVSGDVHLSGGTGQGILLVDGDLDLSGGVEFYGAVVVKGHARSTGTGGHIFGALLAQNADLSSTVITGNSVVDYSSCSVQRALLGASRVKPLRERSWAQLN